MEQPRMQLSATVLGAPDPRALGAFYAELLGWTVVTSEPVWVMLRAPSGGPSLSFQYEPNFVRPVWPAVVGEQQITSHLDIAVDDLDAGVAWARELGATVAEYQPQAQVRVMLDPAGHPFCLFARPD